MDAGCDERQEENGQNLRMDRVLYFLLAEADLLHDGKAVLILHTFGNLLIVNDEHSRHGEHKAERDAHKEEAAIHAANFLRVFDTALKIEVSVFVPEYAFFVRHDGRNIFADRIVKRLLFLISQFAERVGIIFEVEETL